MVVALLDVGFMCVWIGLRTAADLKCSGLVRAIGTYARTTVTFLRPLPSADFVHKITSCASSSSDCFGDRY